ncbi:PspA/IM30 family protein [Catenulispora subtropica]|uniref:Uncharacterized protein n=1 Tax=Catenulispora subtropica TaxID=450798 RepID=A0ABN2SZS6_9ACTN
MTKQTILGRVKQLARADINALLDSAEDPQKMFEAKVEGTRGLAVSSLDAQFNGLAGLADKAEIGKRPAVLKAQ